MCQNLGCSGDEKQYYTYYDYQNPQTQKHVERTKSFIHESFFSCDQGCEAREAPDRYLELIREFYPNLEILPCQSNLRPIPYILTLIQKLILCYSACQDRKRGRLSSVIDCNRLCHMIEP
jgi:hypothetical protein